MNNAQELFQQAMSRLHFFNNELNRPEEDVVAISICHQTRGIIADLLGAYLLLKEKDFSGITNLEGLLKMCAACDRQFSAISLECMECYPGNLHGDQHYCYDLEHAKSCLGLANELMAIVALQLTR